MSIDRTPEVFDEVSRSGYYPEIVAEGLRDALADESVLAYVLHHEPTFDRDEIRRHMTVLALTPGRVVLVHTDEHPPDDLLTSPYTSTTSEAVPVSQVRSVVVTRMVSTSSKQLEEVVLTVGWGAVSRHRHRAGGVRRPRVRGRPRLHRQPHRRRLLAAPEHGRRRRCCSAPAARLRPDPVRGHHPGHRGRSRLMTAILTAQPW